MNDEEAVEDHECAVAAARRAVDAGCHIGRVARIGLRIANARALRELGKIESLAAGKAVA